MSALGRPIPYPAGDVSQRLAARIGALVAELLPAGRRHGHEWVCGSVAGEPGTSLSVNTGGKAGVWADFATGEVGDALDLVAAVRYRGDRRAAYAWALAWLGLSNLAPPPATAAPAPPPLIEAREKTDEAARQNAALRVYLEAQPSLAGTPADAYLQARAIDLRRLGRQPRALRFHPRCWCAEASLHLPALVAAISDAEGRHVATHRTWLAQHAGTWGKAAVPNPKKTLGRPRGGTIRLWRGAGSRALRDAPQGSAVVLGEGIETCLSIAIACPELRVLCAVSLSNAMSVTLPDAVATLVWAADNDNDADLRRGSTEDRARLGEAARAAGLQRVLDHFHADGLHVRLARSPVGKDFNDCLRVLA